MQPYDRERNEDEGQWEGEHEAYLATVTDESLREAGYKEPYPGYFVEDPRHPGWNVYDRYLIDHPGPDWKTKPNLNDAAQALKAKRLSGMPAWDDDQIQGQSLEAWQPKQSSLPPPPTRRVLQTPATKLFASPADPRVVLEIEEPAPTKYSAIWLCQICHRKPALWPTERYWRRSWFGILVTLVFRSPVACTDCRVFNQQATHTVDLWGRRPFWQKVISFWEEPRLLRRLIRHKARQTWKRVGFWVMGA